MGRVVAPLLGLVLTFVLGYALWRGAVLLEQYLKRRHVERPALPAAGPSPEKVEEERSADPRLR